MTRPDEAPRGGRVGMPATLALQRFGDLLYRAFGDYAYHVGSSLTGSPTAKDVDVRMMLEDDDYDALFGAGPPEPGTVNWKWAAMCEAFSTLGQQMTGLPIDFQFQRMTDANRDFDGPRGALGLIYNTPAPTPTGGREARGRTVLRRERSLESRRHTHVFVVDEMSRMLPAATERVHVREVLSERGADESEARSAAPGRRDAPSPAGEAMPFELTERGFRRYEPIPTGYGHVVTVYESSAATEPCVWLEIDGAGATAGPEEFDGSLTAHMRDQDAETLIATLRQALDGHFLRRDTETSG